MELEYDQFQEAQKNFENKNFLSKTSNGVKEIKIEDNDYPEILRKIAKPPKILYYRGKFEKDELCFGVVGTRKCSLYGKQVALDIVGKLADLGITIVSGLAPGIDTFAHQACVEKNKRTIAILGTGLDEKSIYPQSNIALSRKILETGGCLISELPPGTSGSKFTFPNRNRIISGLSQGVLVIEAKIKSGSLITANYAFKQNRKVFAIPGPIYSSNSTGTNRLIKQGAKLVDNVSDILQELNSPVLLQTGLPLEKHKQNYNGNLTPEEKLIIKALTEESLHIDKIIEKTKLIATTVASTLAVLEIEGIIQNLGGNVYALTR
ncbi:DNA-processing protein DprA [Patescibacteria group bacterium]|nr:DNA-processing protein DprA [Patescibacteria group bacterium]